MWIIIPIAAILLILIIGVFMYNNLIKSKLKVENSWAIIDTQLTRRFDLIPNLQEIVKGYTKYEENTLIGIVKSRNQYSNSNTMEDKVKALDNSENYLKSLFALAESYPDLKANQNFLNLQNQLAEIESKIAFSRQFYNDAVLLYNKAVMLFPQNIVAGIFKFKTIKFLESNEAKRENIEIRF